MRRETFHTPGELTLELDNASGEIDVETADVEETVVELTPLRDNEASRRAVEEATVELHGSRLVVDVEGRSFFGVTLNVNRDVRIAVRAPHGTSVVASGAAADIALRGAYGAVEIKTASGDAHVERVGADAQLKSASGDLHVAEIAGDASVQSASGDVAIQRLAGDGKIRSAAGDVFVGEAGGSLVVQTASGDQQLEAIGRGRVELKSASGDILVGIRQGSRAWLDVRSISGETESELEVGDAPADEKGPLVEVAATSMSGDIRIQRAGAPASH